MTDRYGLARGGWAQLVPVLLSALLTIGLVRAGLQISACAGAFPATHAMLALCAAVPALIPLASPRRWLNAGVGLAWLAALFIYLGVNAAPLDLLALLPAQAC
ncbi:MAG: hypothetical protein U1F24_11145 [Alphaproteobacteria bacterium]|jgi:hypothetical protein